jgi:hypothetical protein
MVKQELVPLQGHVINGGTKYRFTLKNDKFFDGYPKYNSDLLEKNSVISIVWIEQVSSWRVTHNTQLPVDCIKHVMVFC